MEKKICLPYRNYGTNGATNEQTDEKHNDRINYQLLKLK